jgi:hypothetical protein
MADGLDATAVVVRNATRMGQALFPIRNYKQGTTQTGTTQEYPQTGYLLSNGSEIRKARARSHSHACGPGPWGSGLLLTSESGDNIGRSCVVLRE